jgi:hypothetical protein
MSFLKTGFELLKTRYAKGAILEPAGACLHHGFAASVAQEAFDNPGFLREGQDGFLDIKKLFERAAHNFVYNFISSFLQLKSFFIC